MDQDPPVPRAPPPRRLALRAMAGVVLLGAAPGALWTGFAPFVPAAAPFSADRVVVLKRRRELLLVRDGRVRARLPVALGSAPRGHKRREGDGRTPEGSYRLDWRWVSPRHGPSIHISYPSPADRARARREGVDPGGAIMIHGLSPALPWLTARRGTRNWTDGCVGLRPRDMRLVWRAVPDGTPIDIRP